jgi:tellurium resistance protein TerZ
MSITLTKAMTDAEPASFEGVRRMSVGASWDPTGGASRGLLGRLKREIGTDLDLLAVLFSEGEPVRFAGLDSLDPVGNGAVTHTGDAQTGKAAGDDEAVFVTFDQIPGHVDAIAFVVAAFKPGSSFDKANNVSLKVYDASDGSPAVVADIWPSLLGSHNAVAVAKAFRVGDHWEFKVLNNKMTLRQGDRQGILRYAQGL